VGQKYVQVGMWARYTDPELQISNDLLDDSKDMKKDDRGNDSS
jgi:hypothetical protein